MKKIAAYYLLLLYILATLKPVLPIVNDMLAHTFNETEHLATVHQHFGILHLHHDLKEAAKDDNDQNNAALLKASEPVSVHLFYEDEIIKLPFFICKNSFFYLSPNLPHPMEDVTAPPPKA